MSDTASENYDFDWIVIGSGFGGSVSALRLAEKGYRVAILECGRRYGDEDFAESTWNLRRYYWMPKLGLRGIFRMTAFKDVFIVSGSGVGGGSLGYANTLYRARPAFFRDAQWGELGDWESYLAPHYETAERMLGVDRLPARGAGRPPAEGVRRGDRRRRHLQAHAGRRVLRRARQGGRGPVLRRRGPAALRLHRLRQLHGRLPAQRQEHPASRTTSGSPRSSGSRSSRSVR